MGGGTRRKGTLLRCTCPTYSRKVAVRETLLQGAHRVDLDGKSAESKGVPLERMHMTDLYGKN